MNFHSLFFLKKPNPTSFFSQQEVHKILQKVKYNIPEINLKIFKNFAPKTPLPIFVENIKNLDPNFAKNLFLANLIFPFLLVIFYTQKNQILWARKILKNAIFLNKNYLSKIQKEQLYCLNINTFSVPPKPQKSPHQILINHTPLSTPKRQNFVWTSFAEVAILRQTFLNGNYYFFENKIKNNKNNYFLIKKYFFSKNFEILTLVKSKKTFIYNVCTQEKIFVLCNQKTQIQLCKTDDGKGYVLEIKIRSKAPEVALYIGKEKINIFHKMLKEKICFLVQNYCFNKIYFCNKKLDYFFNKFLPQKIVQAKIFDQNFEAEKFENKYFLMQKKLIKFKKNKCLFSKKFLGKIVYRFRVDGNTKVVNFLPGQPKIVVDGLEIFGARSVEFEVLKKYNHFDVYA